MEQADIKLVGKYEDENNILMTERYTEYLEDFSTYLLKKNVNLVEVEDLLERLKNNETGSMKEAPQNDKIVYYIEMLLQYNQTDTSYFTVTNLRTEENMLKEFYALNVKKKTLGIKCNDESKIALIQQSETQDQPTCILLSKSNIQFHEISMRLLQKLLSIYVSDIKAQAARAIEESENKFTGKQPKPNYKREIQKKMCTSKKVFLDCRMEGYDFREINLQGAMFINCILNRANFSGCNMEDTFFLDCELVDAMFYKANLNNVKIYHADKIVPATDTYAWLYEGGNNENGER
jgi:hypothetical protein